MSRAVDLSAIPTDDLVEAYRAGMADVEELERRLTVNRRALRDIEDEMNSRGPEDDSFCVASCCDTHMIEWNPYSNGYGCSLCGKDVK